LRVRRGSQARRPRRRIRKLRLLALLTALFLLASVAFSFGLVRAIASEIPRLDPARQTRADDVDSVLYADNGRSVLAVLRGPESRVLVHSIDDVAPIMRQAIVAVEDQRFYEHRGVDLRGIARALWQDVREQHVVEGGSTITQQFVKNAYVRNERTLGRKVREAALAWQLEQRWTKDRILVAYLNTIYFGNGAYGIQQAARTYFNKGASHLTLPEAALLAGLPADPARYDPVRRPRAAEQRRHYVLQTMADQGRIDQIDVVLGDARPLPRPQDVRLPGTRGPAAYFVNYVKDQLVRRYGAGRVFGGGLRVRTTIDLGLQEAARRAIEKVLTNPDGPAAALVAIDPRDGSVKAMFGGSSFRRSQFNLATQAERQPGSAFKPIVLATAFRQGISPETEFESKPVTIDAGDRIWSVRNYEGSYLGRVDLAQALVHSDNSVYAQLTQLVGPKAIVETAHRLGVGSPLDPYFSIGLGALAVNPLDLSRAFATIANGGMRVDGSLVGDRPRVIERVEHVRSGNVQVNRPVGREVLSKAEAAKLTSILEDVVSSGTGRRAQIPGTAVAGKTGTTDNYGDAWFVGYTPSLVAAVWVGYPNELRPMTTEFGGEPVAGGTLPALIWKEFQLQALKLRGGEGETFNGDPYIPATWKRILNRGGWKLDNGYCPNTRQVVFFAGRGPTQTANCKPNEVRIPLVVGSSVEAAREQLAVKPLAASLIFAPAPAKVRPGVVIRQFPGAGAFLSAGDTVRLVIATAPHGLVPNLVGSSVAEARAQLRKLKLKAAISWADGPSGTVLRQRPRAGVAVVPGRTIQLVAAR
jgi:penicillin-binding protein 1A